MDDETTTVNTVIHVTYHQLPIADSGTFPNVSTRSGNGLLYGGSGAVTVLTGIHTGVVSVTLEIRRSAPIEIAIDNWDEVAEVSFEAPNGEAQVTSLMSEVPHDLPLLTPAGPGHYRLRVHARGRDTDPDGVASEPFENYLITVWPAPSAPPTIYKQTDRFGAEQRRRSS